MEGETRVSREAEEEAAVVRDINPVVVAADAADVTTPDMDKHCDNDDDGGGGAVVESLMLLLLLGLLE